MKVGRETAGRRGKGVTTVFDLLMARYGVSRGLAGEYPAGYDDPGAYTPAWQERWTGVDRKDVVRFAREWATTAERTGGKCSILIGAGVNQWYHADLAYRAAITGLVLTGSVGKNGGGLNHYVGQEKLAPVAPWTQIAFGLDWARPPRQQNAPSFHYVHSDQWRYERAGVEARLDPARRPRFAYHAGHGAGAAAPGSLHGVRCARSVVDSRVRQSADGGTAAAESLPLAGA